MVLEHAAIGARAGDANYRVVAGVHSAHIVDGAGSPSSHSWFTVFEQAAMGVPAQGTQTMELSQASTVRMSLMVQGRRHCRASVGGVGAVWRISWL